MGFLSGIKVVDITRGFAGPITDHLMTDYGADIVRIDEIGARRSAEDLVRLRGCSSIAVDLARPEGLELALRLISQADLLLTEPGLDGRQPLPFDYARLSEGNPRLIWCRLTGYGDDGPLVDGWVNDRLIAARHGVDNQPGWRPGPTFIVAPIPSLGAGFLALQGIGAALYMRERTGHGQEVTTSLLAGALAYQPGFVSSTQGPVLNYPGLVGRGPLGQAPFYSIYECADGQWLHFGCLMTAFQQRAVDALEMRAEAEALGFGTPQATEKAFEIMALVTERMKKRPFSEWAALFEERDIPYARSQWTEDLLDDPQVAAEGLTVQVNDPTVGSMTQLASHVAVAGQAWDVPSPAPVVGHHTDEILASIIGAENIAALRAKGVIA